IQVSVTANDVTVRNKLQHVNVASHNWQRPKQVGDNITGGSEGNQLALEGGISFAVHSPEHRATVIPGIGGASGGHQRRPKRSAGYISTANFEDVGLVQVNPGGSICRV